MNAKRIWLVNCEWVNKGAWISPAWLMMRLRERTALATTSNTSLRPFMPTPMTSDSREFRRNRRGRPHPAIFPSIATNTMTPRNSQSVAVRFREILNERLAKKIGPKNP